jgi:ribosomal-protein-serine acetyltransferase
MSTAEIVRVRPFEMDDAANFVAAARESASSVGKWMDWCHADYSIEEAQTWIESCSRKRAEGTAYEFALVDGHTSAH